MSDICGDPDFVVPDIPENEKYEGTEVDANIMKGTYLLPFVSDQPTGATGTANINVALPQGATIKWVSISDASFWAYRGKIDITLPGGQEKAYFLKVGCDTKPHPVTLN